jgi:hypothetical protein
MTHALDKWLPAYLAQALRPRPGPPPGRPLTLLVAVADHFEPFGGGADRALALERLAAWERGLPRLAEGLADAAGRPPRHDFFYPLEDYDPEVLDRLARLREAGLGEVEVHLHHQGESPAELEDLLAGHAERLARRHGLLRPGAGGRPAYGFVHGNWALDNALPGGRWCGVNGELAILARTGCFADFTLPAAPSPAQVRTINSIYYARSRPGRPRGHERGRAAAVGAGPWGDLLLIQGVLALDWRRRRRGLLPAMENSELGAHRPPRPGRLAAWLRFAPSVAGAEEVRFLKLHCHGAPRRHHPALLGPPARALWERLLAGYHAGQRFRTRFVTCWEMAQAVHALERGEKVA